ncbi:hypothetical protein ACY2DA_01825 [Staphylococcus simulans]
MKINIANALTKRLGKLESKFKHYADDMSYLTLVSGIDKTLKDLLGIQVFRQAASETVARDMGRLDLAILNHNTLTDMVKLRTVYAHDFEPNINGLAGHAVATIQRDFNDALKKMTNPPKSWVYHVSDQTKCHYVAVYIDVNAKKDFELPETKSAFLKQYPELKEGDLVYKSIQNHQQERDHSIEEIVEEPLQVHVIAPALKAYNDLQVRQSDIQTLYKGEYKEFEVTVYLQVFKLGYHLDEEKEEVLETTLTTDDQGEVIAKDALEEDYTVVKEEPNKEDTEKVASKAKQDQKKNKKAKQDDKAKKDKKKKDKKGKKKDKAKKEKKDKKKKKK